LSSIEIKINEKYFEMVPRPTKEERQALKYSMMLEGQKDPIVINENGVVLDGHTRFEICQELKIKPITRIAKFASEDMEERYVVEANTNRRQLNAYQKVEMFYHIFKKFRDEAEDNHKNSRFAFKNHPLGGSLRRYSALIGVGEKRTFAAIKIIETADEHTKQRLRNGNMTVNEAFSKIQYLKKINLQKTNNYKRYPSTTKLLQFLKDDPVEYDHVKKLIEKYWSVIYK